MVTSAFEWCNAAEKFRAAFYLVIDYLEDKEGMGVVAAVDCIATMLNRLVYTNDSGLITFQTNIRFYKEVLCPTLAHMFCKHQLIPEVHVIGEGPPGAYFAAPLDPSSSVREYSLHLYPGKLYTGKGDACIRESSVPSLIEFLQTVVGVKWRGRKWKYANR